MRSTLHHSSSNHRHLDFFTESLEVRQMLAGDVSVTARHGDVVITGDNSANEISVRDSSSGYVQVRGHNGTKINGVNNGVSHFAIEDDLRINLKHGNNLLLLGDYVRFLHVPDDVVVRTGSGDDFVMVFNLVAMDDLSINLGSGSNLVHGATTGTYFAVGDDVKLTSRGQLAAIVHWSVVDDVKISTGHADDSVEYHGYIGGKLAVSMRGGDDDLLLDGTSVQGDISVAMHGGNDTFNFLSRPDAVSYAGGDIRVSMSHGYDIASITAELSPETTIAMSGIEAG